MTNKYNSSSIYIIEPKEDGLIGDVYIGSTVKTLAERLCMHNSAYKRYKLGKCCHIRVFDIFDKYGVENCHILLLKIVDVENKKELEKHEAYHIRMMLCVNKVIPDRTRHEWYLDNHTEIRTNQTVYRNLHKNKMKDYQSVYRAKTQYEAKQYQAIYRAKKKLEKLIIKEVI